VPPPRWGEGVVIRYEHAPKLEDPEEIKVRVNSIFGKIIKEKIESKGGNVIENRETTIGGIYAARRLC